MKGYRGCGAWEGAQAGSLACVGDGACVQQSVTEAQTTELG